MDGVAVSGTLPSSSVRALAFWQFWTLLPGTTRFGIRTPRSLASFLDPIPETYEVINEWLFVLAFGYETVGGK
jgi:hypothetical protein